ncbi:MAG: hypothetical protein RL456_88 [Pseudomonadota bacterium]|jgi:hypothetical protein
MPHVLRDAQGRIASVHRDPVPGSEALPPEHPELRALLGEAAGSASFASLDAGLIRVLEDLVDVLIARNILCITDLPPEAQHKLFARKNFRDRFQRNALQLYDSASPLGTDALIPTVGMDAIPMPPVRRRRL